MIPNKEKANPATVEYIGSLIRRTGKSAAWCARRIGITARQLNNITAGRSKASYPIQFALECLAEIMETLRK